MERDKSLSGNREYTNGEITVYWKPVACVHASYCYRELIEVFDPSSRPWVDMKGAPTARIIEVVNMCPTEALTWKWNDEEKNTAIDINQTNHIKFRRPELLKETGKNRGEEPVSVKVMIDGPIVIKGSFTLVSKGNTKDIKQGLISICRCGASDQLPFCDGRHRKVGYTD
ncbi:MAG: (4Fe-4S)-binding protein [Bacteroidales bacterium]|nr:(4Fe-4S)-binding protein [Bacteroidales bacterium]